VVGSEERVLKVGEWTDWVPISLHLVPTQSVSVIARFYLKAVRPDFALYVTPLNLDPRKPAMPISHPGSYAAELATATGLFYTQGMPEDTKALKGGVFNQAEFVGQARMAGDEVVRQYAYVLARFRNGRYLRPIILSRRDNADTKDSTNILTRPMAAAAPITNPRVPAATRTNAPEEDLPAGFKLLAANSGLVEKVTGPLLADAGPEAKAKFNELFGGLMSGKMSVEDIRNLSEPERQ
jgi:hypothetical protein